MATMETGILLIIFYWKLSKCYHWKVILLNDKFVIETIFIYLKVKAIAHLLLSSSTTILAEGYV
ncbi:MAG TPA: hypothetical protein VHJ38_16905 [Nitrososphaeraceae archaeon]|nr:hypothetical protein [Nitrososphaeraceae archaeon]